MDTSIIYQLPNVAETSLSEVVYCDRPAPYLVKFGYNSVNQKLDILALTANHNYRSALRFNIHRDDDQSIRTLLGLPHASSALFELWEIFSTFQLLTDKTQIYAPGLEHIDDMISMYGKQFNLSGLSVSKKSDTSNLHILFFSPINIDENSATQLAVNELSKNIKKYKKNSTLIVQLFGMQSPVTAQLITYLSSHYSNSYIIKPHVTEYILDYQYLVLIGLKDTFTDTIDTNPDQHLISLGIDVPNEIDTIITCYQSQVIPLRYCQYFKIYNFLQFKVYDGALYQDYLAVQNNFIQKWISTYTSLELSKTLLDMAVNTTSDTCVPFSQVQDTIMAHPEQVLFRKN